MFACLLDKYSHQVYSLILKVVETGRCGRTCTGCICKVFRNLSSFKGIAFPPGCTSYTNTAKSRQPEKENEFLAIEESIINNVSEESCRRLRKK